MQKHKSCWSILLIVCLFLGGMMPSETWAQNKKKDKNITPANATDSLSYMVGVSIGYNLKMSKIPAVNPAFVAKGVEQSFYKDTSVLAVQEASMYLNNYMTKLQEKQGQENIEKGKKFLEDNLKLPGVIQTASGLQIKTIQEGTGKSPIETDKVRCHYRGRLITGVEFDSSYDRGQPAEFPLNGVIQGWIEGLQLMKEGGKYELYIPGDLAYGSNGAGEMIGPNETLIFEIELLEVLSE